MAGPTLAALQEEVYRCLDEPPADTDNPRFPLVSVTRQINAALSSLPRRLNHDFFKAQSYLNATTGNITLPTNYLCHPELAFRPAATASWQRLMPIRARMLDQKVPGWDSMAVGPPRWFVMQFGATYPASLLLVPQPNTTYTAGLKIRFTVAPTALTTGASTADVLQYFPEQQYTYVPFYAAARLCTYEGGAASALAQQLDAMADAEIANMRMVLKSHEGDPDPAMGYGSNY